MPPLPVDTDQRIELILQSPLHTASVAKRLGAGLVPGDTLLLEGPIGAGKTHFARNLISALLIAPEDIPSPTFTLVQEYETVSGPLWHADLYRLTGPSEIEELGLIDAMGGAICLIEWPDRLGLDQPHTALRLALSPMEDADHRRLTLSWQVPSWQARLEAVL